MQILHFYSKFQDISIRCLWCLKIKMNMDTSPLLLKWMRAGEEKEHKKNLLAFQWNWVFTFSSFLFVPLKWTKKKKVPFHVESDFKKSTKKIGFSLSKFIIHIKKKIHWPKDGQLNGRYLQGSYVLALSSLGASTRSHEAQAEDEIS